MSRFKHSINSEYTQHWVERVGKIVLNFSAIEFESILWLVQLAERELEIQKITDTTFTSRVTQIMYHTDERAIGVQWRKKSLRTWNEALKLAHLRNQVAHNPVIFGWNTLPEAEVPNVLGIPNIRARSSKNASGLLSIESADKSINSMANIAQMLAELRIEWCAARDQDKAPPLKAQRSLWYKFRRHVSMVIYALKKT